MSTSTAVTGSMLIDGELTGSSDGTWIESVNPADEEPIGRVPAGTAEDIDRAVVAASAAQIGWAATDIEQRAGALRALSAGLIERAEEIARLEALDTGSTIGKMRDDVVKAARYLDFFAGLGYELKGETIPATAENLHLTVREPIGVVGRIVPFNHPIMFAASRLAAPLMAGNTVVLKPPEQAPLSSSVLAELCREHLPAGAANIVTGYGHTVGDALVRHPGVRRLALTGSAATGMVIQRAAADVSVKNVSLELGGKNPCIIFPDADRDAALQAAVAGMNFAWQGQSCGSVSRLLVHDSMYDEAVERVGKTVRALVVGDPLDPASDMGPVISAQQRDKVVRYLEAGVEDGARLVAGGGVPGGEKFAKGYWVEPTVFADVTPDMRIFKEEIFGPVLSIIRWSDDDEVVRMANDVDYGLTASIWTQDLKRALVTARRIQAGYVWINGVSRHYKAVPFGGVKNSGIGREESLEELYSYTDVKAINIIL